MVAVVNASPFISGRYPNLGPELLARSGVVLVDDVGRRRLRQGQGRRDGAAPRRRRAASATTRWPPATCSTADEIGTLMDEARTGLSTQLQSFTHNTTEFLRREQELLLHGQGVPQTCATELEGRPVVVVVRGFDYREDLRGLRRLHPRAAPGPGRGRRRRRRAARGRGTGPTSSWSARSGLGHGAPPTSEPGSTVSDRALRDAREVVLHADRSGRAVGADRLDRLGVRHQTHGRRPAPARTSRCCSPTSTAPASSSRSAPHATLDEFLDRQRAGLASTFLTRLRVGPKLVDATRRPAAVRRPAAAVAPGAGDPGWRPSRSGSRSRRRRWASDWWASIGGALSDVLDWIQGLFS